MRHQDKPEAYYAFRDEAREVSFKRYDMPTPWMNYLSNGTLHAMISHAGGGVAFYQSPQIWRLNHYRFFHLPTDRSGFYTYIKDGDSIWCPTNMPVNNRPDRWESSHGMGYSRFQAEKDGVSVCATYLIGQLENAMIWNLKLCADTDKTVTLYPYVELGMMEFMRELQWQCYNKHQLSVDYLADEEILVYRYGVESQPKPKETPLVYFAASQPISGFEGDRDEFIGAYRSEENPEGVESGELTGSLLAGGDPCFALQIPISLKANETVEVNIFLGTAMTVEEIREAVRHCRQSDFVGKSYQKLQEDWSGHLSAFQCELPDASTQRMVNIWNPYQAQRNFSFSRNLSYYATGTFRGVGYRDTAQDILAIIPFDLDAAKDKTRLLLSQQYQDGHVNHYFFPTEGYDPVTSIHSDDHLWTILTVWTICNEEGSYGFLNELVSWYDGGKSSIYDHLKQAITFTKKHLGQRGFPLMLRSDWNDALFRVCREGKGESIWTAMQLGMMLLKMQELATAMGEQHNADEYAALYESQKALINTIGWDGNWYRRAIMDSGEYVGIQADEEARLWLNAQSWAVLSEMGETDKQRMAMDSVYEILNTPLGIKKIHPPIVNYPNPEDPLTNYQPGTGENGSVFCHANTWAIIAECMLGNGERAYEYYHKLIPAVAMDTAGVWRYKAEPYVYASNIFGPDSMRFGLANVSWLTGTAAWMYIAVTQFMLGVRAVYDGLMIKPCLPAEWKNARVKRRFRGCLYDIHIKQEGKGKKQMKLTVDGCEISGNVISHVEGRSACKVEVLLVEMKN